MSKGMPIHDSIIRSDGYDDIYSTVRNPRMPQVRKPESLEDVAETEQEKMEREILEEFQKNNFRAGKESAHLLLGAGKLLFLSVMLPPYLLFYKLPKWVMVDVIGGTVKKLTQGVQAMTSAISRPFQFFWGAKPSPVVEKLEDKPGFDIFAVARNGVYSLGNKIFHPLFQATQWLMNGVASVQQAGNAFFNHTKGKFGAAWENTKNRIKEGVEVVRRGFKYAGMILDKNFVQPAAYWLISRTERIARTIKRIRSSAANQVNRMRSIVYQTFRHPILTLQKLADNIRAYPRLLWRTMTNFAAQATGTSVRVITQNIRKAQETVRSASRRVKETYQKVKEKVRESIDSIDNLVQNIVDRVLAAPYLMVQRIGEWVVSWSGSNALYVKKLFQSVVKTSRSVVDKTYGFIVFVSRPIKNALKALSRRVRQGMEMGSRAFSWILSTAKALPSVLKRKGHEVLISLKSYILKFLTALKRILAWVRVFFRLGMQLVRELSEEISNWFTHEKA